MTLALFSLETIPSCSHWLSLTENISTIIVLEMYGNIRTEEKKILFIIAYIEVDLKTSEN